MGESIASGVPGAFGVIRFLDALFLAAGGGGGSLLDPAVDGVETCGVDRECGVDVPLIRDGLKDNAGARP